MYNVLQTMEHNLPQGQPVNFGAEGNGRIAMTTVYRPRKQCVPLRVVFGVDPRSRLSRCRLVQLEQILRQAPLQGTVSQWVDMNSVSLASKRRGLVALINRHVNSCFPEALRQAEAPNSAAYNQD